MDAKQYTARMEELRLRPAIMGMGLTMAEAAERMQASIDAWKRAVMPPRSKP